MYIHVYTTDTVTGLYVIAHLVGCMSKYLAVLNSWCLMSLFFASEIPISLGKIHRILVFPRGLFIHIHLAARPGRSYKTTPKVMGPH